MGRPWMTHLKIRKLWDPMGTHWVNYKYLFSNQMFSDKKHIAWKLVFFCIDSYKQLFNIEKGSRIIVKFSDKSSIGMFWNFSYFSWIATMTPKENRNENIPKLISGIFGKKFMGTHCNALNIITISIIKYIWK
jgi:hypothetical protein